MKETFESKLGTTRAGDRTRIWIEGKRLAAAGFTVGVRFQRLWDAKGGKLVIAICSEDVFAETARAERGTVSGKGDKPIIDVTGARVAAHFKGASVRVEFLRNRIVVTNA